MRGCGDLSRIPAYPLFDLFDLQRCCVRSRLRGNQCNIQHLLQRLDGMEVEDVPHFFRHVFDIRLVPLRDDDGLDPRAMSTEYFLLQATDWEHAAAQSDL